jgi:hypothetical protein
LARVGAAIPRRNNKNHTVADAVLYRNVKRRRSAATKTHVGNRWCASDVMRNNPVNAGNYTRC